MGLPFFNKNRAPAAAPRKQNRRVQQVKPRAAAQQAAPAVMRKPAVTTGRAGVRGNKRVAGAPRAGAKPAIAGPRGGLKAALTGALAAGSRGRRAFGLLGRLAVAVALAWGVLLAVQAGYQYVTTSARFEARSLVFEPTPHVPVDRLQALMGIEPGTNILAVDTDALRAKIADEPWVKAATVERSLPDTLVVDVKEHQAAAVLSSGYFYLIDADGVPFKRLDEGERGELPVITGVDREQLVRGDARATTAIRRGLEVLAAYQEAPRPRLSEIHVDDGGAVSLYTAKSGAALRLGRGAPRERLERFDALRAALGERAEKLAVVHLDLEAAAGAPARVVASFFDPADEAAVLSRGAGAKGQDSKDSPAKAGAAAPKPAAAPEQAPGKPGKPGKGKIKGKPVQGSKAKGDAHHFPSGIPHYD